MTKPIKFAHVVYQTRRYDAMIAWYQAVFEATIVHRDPALAFLTYDDEHHRFAFANLDVLKPEAAGDARGAIGVNHVAYTYASAADLLATYSRLKTAGIEPYWPVHHGITLSLYYMDPDGNRMEFQVDAMADYMESEAFHANPVGIDYDPEALVVRWQAGESEAELLRMPVGTMSAIPPAHGMT
jgi:catechol-2,3-dioxygenase